MEEFNPTAFQSIMGGFVAIIIAAAIFFRKIHAMVASDILSGTASNTQVELIDLLRTQIRTFSDNNTALNQEVNSLRRENINSVIETTKLTHELEVLRRDNQELRAQIEMLRDRIQQLTSALESLGKGIQEIKQGK